MTSEGRVSTGRFGTGSNPRNASPICLRVGCLRTHRATVTIADTGKAVEALIKQKWSSELKSICSQRLHRLSSDLLLKGPESCDLGESVFALSGGDYCTSGLECTLWSYTSAIKLGWFIFAVAVFRGKAGRGNDVCTGFQPLVS